MRPLVLLSLAGASILLAIRTAFVAPLFRPCLGESCLQFPWTRLVFVVPLLIASAVLLASSRR